MFIRFDKKLDTSRTYIIFISRYINHIVTCIVLKCSINAKYKGDPGKVGSFKNYGKNKKNLKQ